MTKPIVEVSFGPDRESANRYALELSKSRFLSAPNLIFSALFIVVITALGAWNEYIDTYFLLAAIIFPGVVVVLLPPIIGFVVQRNFILRVYKELGKITYQFWADSLVVRTDKTEQKIAYSMLERAVSTPNGIIIKLISRQMFFIPNTIVNESVKEIIQQKIPPSAKRARKKYPWLAAVMNGLLFGSGYLYAGKKKLFATTLLVADGLAIAALISFQQLSFGDWRQDLSFVLISLALAVDGFNVARSVNKMPKSATALETSPKDLEDAMFASASPRRKRPWIAAILNIVPGLGYLYLGVRRVFAVLLLAYLVGTIIYQYTDPAFGSYLRHEPSQLLLLAVRSLFYIAFIIDAYLLGRSMNRKSVRLERGPRV